MIPDNLRAALADRYELTDEIGRGGMATVYLANDRKHRRSVAVKVLRPELAATLGADRFLKEIEIAARLTHPHILTLIDSGQAGSVLYYVMPFVEGESVRGLLMKEGRLNVEDAIAIAKPVGDALTYAHRMGVVHRDIKPENILFSQGHAVVSDFGIAKAVSTAGVHQQLTRTGFPIGTPGYMSPEQAAGRAHLDPTTDVFSLACVVYEMLVGETPGLWVTEESLEVRRFVDAEPGHRKKLDRLPGRVEQALVQAMAMRPKDRFGTPDAFVSALESANADRPSYRDEDVRAIVGQAARLEAAAPTEDGALTIGTVEQIAAEVGISPDRVRRAVRERDREPTSPGKPNWFLGGPITLAFERIVDGEVPETEYPIFVEEIRRTIGNVGHVSTLGKSMAWSTAGPNPGQGRDVHLTVSPRRGLTAIRVEEKMTNVAGGLFGGIMGGGGGGGGAMAAALGAEVVGSALAAVGFVAIAIGGSYALSRTIFRSVVQKRSRDLERLVDRLADHAADTAVVPSKLRKADTPRLIR